MTAVLVSRVGVDRVSAIDPGCLGISWARVVRFNGRLLGRRAAPGSVVRIPPGVPSRPIYRGAPTA